MKYEVIGWTTSYTSTYPKHENVTACVDAAIIREIRKHGYLFGGDRHEDYCPVLNDGTYVSYSWRGWGRIMALAYNKEGEYSYMFAYMDSRLEPSSIKVPEEAVPDERRIVPKEWLTETFTMRLADDMFEAVKAGTKTVEIRLFDDKRKLVDIGDYIEFIKLGDDTQKVTRRVADLWIYKSFKKTFGKENLNDDFEWETSLRYPPESVGSPANATPDEMAEAMYKYYTKEQEEKYGVIAFVLEKPRHLVRTSFRAGFGLSDGADIYAEMLTNPAVSADSLEKMEKARFDGDAIETELYNIGCAADEDCNMGILELFLGGTERYGANVNEMARETLKNLLGKEDKLRELRYKYCLSYTLQINVSMNGQSNEPAPKPDFDGELVEFLKNIGGKFSMEISYERVKK